MSVHRGFVKKNAVASVFLRGIHVIRQRKFNFKSRSYLLPGKVIQFIKHQSAKADLYDPKCRLPGLLNCGCRSNKNNILYFHIQTL